MRLTIFARSEKVLKSKPKDRKESVLEIIHNDNR